MADGTVTAADLPALLPYRGARAGLIPAPARHPTRAEAATAFLPRLPHHKVEQGVRN